MTLQEGFKKLGIVSRKNLKRKCFIQPRKINSMELQEKIGKLWQSKRKLYLKSRLEKINQDLSWLVVEREILSIKMKVKGQDLEELNNLEEAIKDLVELIFTKVEELICTELVDRCIVGLVGHIRKAIFEVINNSHLNVLTTAD